DNASTVVREGARLCRGAAWAACVCQGGLRLDSDVVKVAVPSRRGSPALRSATPIVRKRGAPPRRAPRGATPPHSAPAAALLAQKPSPYPSLHNGLTLACNAGTGGACHELGAGQPPRTPWVST